MLIYFYYKIMNRFEVEVGGVMIQVPPGTAESWWCLILDPVTTGEDGVKRCITVPQKLANMLKI